MSILNTTTNLNLRHSLIVMAITLVACLSTLTVYLNGPLQGNFNHFFLPAQKFGVPAELRERGIQELYQGSIESGWDGQFYFYISNDLLALKDTAQHIDSNAYRYQRIGLPLLANLVSKVTLQSWVSPLTYYMTSLMIVLVAVGMAAFFFQKKGISPYWVLFWALGIGTQVTQLNGLPDAAADGLLIIALLSLIQGQLLIYAFAIVLAALAREAYVLLPALIVTALLMHHLKVNGVKSGLTVIGIFRFFNQTLIHIIPILVVIAWQIFIRIKFGTSPSSQANNILDWPLISSFHYMIAGFSGTHPVVGTGRAAYAEGAGILMYLFLLLASTLALRPLLTKANLSDKGDSEKPILFGLASGFMVLISLYLFFGSTVMMYHTGYLKAASIFLFVLPFAAALGGMQFTMLPITFLILFSSFSTHLLWGRISSSPYFPQQQSMIYAENEPTCLKDYRAILTPKSVEDYSSNSLINKLLVERRLTINTEITNMSAETFSPYNGKGAVNASYHWVLSNNQGVVKDGGRTELRTLEPNQSAIVPIRVQFPNEPGDYILKLTLVQEGCNWFYLANPDSVFNIPYKIR